MAQPPPSVRRVPLLLTALATIVVLVAVLGAVGVLKPPSTASASTQLSQLAPAAGDQTTPETSVEADATDAGAADGTAAQAPSGTAVSSSTVTDRLVATTTSLVDALWQPADDAAVPGPVDTALVPAAPPTASDAAALPADSGEGRRVIYSIHGQRVWVVEADGTIARTYLVSGRLDRPGPGSYEVYSKSPTAISYDSSERMQYLIRFAHGENAAIGFQDIPVLADGTPAQAEDQLGQPLSGGCVRQAEADAEFLWAWAEVGTTVVVVA